MICKNFSFFFSNYLLNLFFSKLFPFKKKNRNSDKPEDMEILINDSGKLKFLVNLLNYLKSENHRVLIFSQSKIMLNIIQSVLNFKVIFFFLFPS